MKSPVCNALEEAKPYPKADIAAMTPQEREQLRLRSKAIPLVVDKEPLDIIYEDDAYLIVNKPAFLKMHPIHRFQGGTLLNRCIGHLGKPPHLCHRLDMHTSGVVMFVKRPQLCTPILTEFKERRVRKSYLCLVDFPRGCPPAEFSVNQPIERHSTVSIARQIGDSSPDSKRALTYFRVASASPTSSIVLLHAAPKTGRTHQIRLHAKHVAGNDGGIVGDDIYGRERSLYTSIDHVRKCSLLREDTLYADGDPLRAGLKLHAWQLSFENPLDGKTMTFCAPPPESFRAMAESQGIAIPSAGTSIAGEERFSTSTEQRRN
jgi:23S rRNA pseudouridine1911/1915/1917 synthase